MKNLSNSLIIGRAMSVAQAAHAGQAYGESDYYERHILDVVTSFVGLSPGALGNSVNAIQLAVLTEEKCLTVTAESVAAAFLHDAVEDTDLSLSTVQALFGDDVAHMVDIVTDPEGDNRKARKKGSNAKLAMARDLADGESALRIPASDPNFLALKIKVADRTVNYRNSLEWNTSTLDMYVKEMPAFLEVVTPRSPRAMADQDFDHNLNFLKGAPDGR